MKSKKNEELNFLYTDDKKNNKKKKSSKTPKKQVKKKTNTQNENDVFNFDNEIVIGVTPIIDETEKKNVSKVNKKKKAPNKNVKTSQNKGAEKKSAPNNIKKKVRKKKNETRKNVIVKNVIKWTILLGALVAAFIFFMMSPLFNVVEIDVTGNNIISDNTIISLSEIKIGDNIYKTSKNKIKQNVKQNAYIESVEVKRIIPNKIQLIINERKPTYMLEYANSYAYINNQGYILEISSQSIDVPIISGFTTQTEEIEVGARLNKEDLTRLETVLKIIESTEVNGVISKIDRINISDKQNYKLYMADERKTIYLGDASNLSTRMLYLKAVLDDTKGLEGEIFINGDLVKEKAFFRQKE
jgi:cell division protein FtsQ